MTTAAAAAAASEMLRHCVRSSVGLINADRVTTRAVRVRSPDLLVLVHLPPPPPSPPRESTTSLTRTFDPLLPDHDPSLTPTH